VLRIAATDFAALNEIGAPACASGHRTAARTAYAQAARHHRDNPIERINLGNLLLAEGEISANRARFGGARRRSGFT
jgi:Flp pilus assembly protein TadD